MNENARKLFKTFDQFKKLNMASLMPDLSVSENMTLHAIERVNRECEQRNEKAKVSMLACDIHTNPTQVSRTLKSLEERGLIERTVNKQDRRITYVQLTEDGKKKHEESSRIIDEFTDAVFSQIEEKDMERLIEYLNQMYEVASKEIGKRKEITKINNEKGRVKDEQNI